MPSKNLTKPNKRASRTRRRLRFASHIYDHANWLPVLLDNRDTPQQLREEITDLLLSLSDLTKTNITLPSIVREVFLMMFERAFIIGHGENADPKCYEECDKSFRALGKTIERAASFVHIEEREKNCRVTEKSANDIRADFTRKN